jgi:hypothetical protein
VEALAPYGIALAVVTVVGFAIVEAFARAHGR